MDTSTTRKNFTRLRGIFLLPLDFNRSAGYSSSMSLLRALIVFSVLAVIGGILAGLGYDATESEVTSLPLVIAGSFFIALAGGVFLIVLAKGGLLLIDLIMFPGEPGDPPPALYKLPEWYISENRFGEALAEYEKIAKAHPREPECWAGMVDVLATHMGNLDGARKAARKGLRKLRSKETRDQLKRHYHAVTGEQLKPSFFLSKRKTACPDCVRAASNS